MLESGQNCFARVCPTHFFFPYLTNPRVRPAGPAPPNGIDPLAGSSRVHRGYCGLTRGKPVEVWTRSMFLRDRVNKVPINNDRSHLFIYWNDWGMANVKRLPYDRLLWQIIEDLGEKTFPFLAFYLNDWMWRATSRRGAIVRLLIVYWGFATTFAFLPPAWYCMTKCDSLCHALSPRRLLCSRW